MLVQKRDCQTIINTLKYVLTKIITSKVITYNFDYDHLNLNVEIERSKSSQFGDYCSNVAITLFKDPEKRKLFAKMVAKLIPKSLVILTEISPNGFINMFINEKYLLKTVKQVLNDGSKYGQFKKRKDFYNLEFVSANPTGLLHIGHARNAAIGDSLTRIWKCYGISVNKEYYINDGGNQIDKLGLSLLIRYKQKLNKKANMPEDAYHGQEINEIADKLITEIGDKYVDVKYDDQHILENKAIALYFSNYAKNYLLNLIKKDLIDFKVEFDIWFSELSLYGQQNKLINGVTSILSDYIYKQDGATLLKTTTFGDDKDRVLIKSDGSLTYFTPDITYHYIKLSRGYSKIFNIWGSDHKSYIDRMSAALQMLGFKKELFNVLTMQMIRLTENGKEFIMSKRTGNSLTLRDLVSAIGKDAARWYLVSQPLTSHLEIDIARAKKQSNDNPIYYVQYAYARINQLMTKAKEVFGVIREPLTFNRLILQQELDLINSMLYFKHTIELIATKYEVNKMTIYLTTLAKQFHNYYANVQMVNKDDKQISIERLYLAKAVQQVIKNGLTLLGIDAIEKM